MATSSDGVHVRVNLPEQQGGLKSKQAPDELDISPEPTQNDHNLAYERLPSFAMWALFAFWLGLPALLVDWCCCWAEDWKGWGVPGHAPQEAQHPADSCLVGLCHHVCCQHSGADPGSGHLPWPACASTGRCALCLHMYFATLARSSVHLCRPTVSKTSRMALHNTS